MSFNLHAVRTFINVDKKNQNVLVFLLFFSDFTVHHGACELGIKSALSPNHLPTWHVTGHGLPLAQAICPQKARGNRMRE